MIDLFVFLIVLAVCSLVAHVTGLFRARPRQSAADKVRTELFVADQRISSEYHRARSAMNKAAGQDWRNLVD
ncbi:hypothetical protein [Gordonia iterans]